MMKLMNLLTLCLMVALTSGCSSIVTGAKKKVQISSNPSGASFMVVDEKGKTVAEGITPQIVKLKTGKAYFRKKAYNVKLNLNGHEAADVDFKGAVSGWYFGNLLFGGLIGLFVVDPLTGAVYTLQEEVIVDLEPTPVLQSAHQPWNCNPRIQPVSLTRFPNESIITLNPRISVVL